MECKYFCLDLYDIGVTYRGIGEGEFMDVLPHDLTVDKPVNVPFDRSHRTLFKEVSIKPFRELVYDELSSIRPVGHSPGWEKGIFELFCDIIEERYEGSFLGLSSGYDSRLMALALHRRGLKINEYVECFGETEGFDAVVRYLKIKNYRKFYRPGILMEYIGDCVDGYNGLVGMHLNPFWTPYPDNTNLLTGCGANTLTECMKSYDNYFTKMAGIKHHTDFGERILLGRKWSYYSQLTKYKIRGNIRHAFSDYRFIREIAKVKNWQTDKRRFSQVILGTHTTNRCAGSDQAGVEKPDTRRNKDTGWKLQ